MSSDEVIEVGDLVKIKTDFALEFEAEVVGIVLEVFPKYYYHLDPEMNYDKVSILWAGDRNTSTVPTPKSTIRRKEIDVYLEARRTAEPSNALTIVSKGKK
jgi:hypothetical protein